MEPELLTAEAVQILSDEPVEESKQLKALLSSEKQRYEKRVQERVEQRHEETISSGKYHLKRSPSVERRDFCVSGRECGDTNR